MLELTITKTAIYFKNLNDEMYGEVKEQFPELKLGNTPNKITYMIEGDMKELYYILYKLSCYYDIEM